MDESTELTARAVTSSSSEDIPYCLNYEVCKMKMPNIEFTNGNSSFCILCSIVFNQKKILENIDIEECPICYATNKRGVVYPKCNHHACIECFHRCFFGKIEKNEPKFPHENLEEEYRNNPDDIIWNNYPLIEKYNLDWIEWSRQNNETYLQEEHLRKCPICRQ